MKRRGICLAESELRTWEQTGDVYVYATKSVESSNVDKTVEVINDLIREFNLPLHAVNGNATKSEDTSLVEDLIIKNTKHNLINCKSVLEELKSSWNNDVFRYGLVVLVHPQRYQFRNEPSDPEPAKYGWSDDEGLSLLRRYDDENAVRHEFGHMVGLAKIEHHSSCAMDYLCSTYEFCENCRQDINERWG